MSTSNRPNQAGFTLIELLIATTIFSFILIVITAAVLQFSRQYYKGIISSSTQSVARSLIDDVTRAIEYNGGAVSELTLSTGTTPAGYCIGSAKRYSFALGQQVVDGTPSGSFQSYHGLVSDTVTGCTAGPTALKVLPPLNSLTGLVNGRELLGAHMRLSKFSITPNSTSGLYTIVVRVIYGDDDLLCSPTAGDCSTSTMTNLTASDLMCRPTIGSQFCAVSELTTTVKKRVN